MRRFLHPYFGLAIAMCLGLPGCGGSSFTEVTGRVTYNGKPLDRPGGTISFLGPDGVPHTAQIDTSGTYRASGVCLGENKVSVFYPRSVSAASSKKQSRVPDSSKALDPAKVPDSLFLIPERYAAPETSELTVVVDKNTVYNPDLTGPAIR
jgi:hypothetical protein